MKTYSKKICLLGDFAVGKTSLVRRFVHNRFDDHYLSTIGVKVSRKTVMVPVQGEVIELTLMVWDLAGSQEFSPVTTSYLRGAAGAILVCDLTRADTLGNLARYATEIRKVCGPVSLLVAANKMDLVEQHRVTSEQVATAATQLQATHFLTSAKVGDEVDMMFRHLGQLLLE
ncbi:MAG: GTP-binding protein [Caldilineaceae bacterium]|nr:GTP-binding protein [Caldilineaceae bacterium]